MSFDYGSKLPDGQYQRHPSELSGEYIAPFRKVYVHKECNESTSCPDHVAETYAKHPMYYDRTFCVRCGNYFPISEFYWQQDGVQLGKVSNDECYDFYVNDKKYNTLNNTVTESYIRTIANVPDEYTLCIVKKDEATEFIEKYSLKKIELFKDSNFWMIPPAKM